VFDGNAVDLCHHTISPIQFAYPTNLSDMQGLGGVTGVRSSIIVADTHWFSFLE